MKKYENFCKALDNLRLVRDLNEPYDVLTLTGSAALFEICFEQAWKAMKEILQEHVILSMAAAYIMQLSRLLNMRKDNRKKVLHHNFSGPQLL